MCGCFWSLCVILVNYKGGKVSFPSLRLSVDGADKTSFLPSPFLTPFLFSSSSLFLLLSVVPPYCLHLPPLPSSLPSCASSRRHSRAPAWAFPSERHGRLSAVSSSASPSSSSSFPHYHPAQSQPQW